MTRLRRLKSQAPAHPLEDDNLLSEILLRLPPQPSSLPRASLVCKRWLGLVSETGFLRRFRAHHRRNPPLLGLFFEDVTRISFIPTLASPNRVPSGRLSFQFDEGDQCRFMGCRHGLALIFNSTRLQVQLWHPVTGKQLRLAVPREFGTADGMLIQNGAVLRADGYVHTGRRSSPSPSPSPSPSTFKAVLVGQDVRYTRAFACVYSFETRLWSNLIATPLPSRDNPMGVPNVIPGSIPCLISMDDPSVLVGNSLYWNLLGNSRAILVLDLDRQSLSVIPMPVDTYADDGASFRVMPAEGGGLGLFFLSDFSAQLWKRKTDPDGVASWVMGRTIELDKLLPLDPVASLSILGFAEESNVVFLRTPIHLFMVQLESLQFRKLFETWLWCICHPFESVYTAGNSQGS
uniref:Uncharacterized protein n=1 Tax=Avena sativa TaxID=4498 RepID=A0ACD5YZX4_AVESA